MTDETKNAPQKETPQEPQEVKLTNPQKLGLLWLLLKRRNERGE